jgi:predicted P-loop ATPase
MFNNGATDQQNYSMCRSYDIKGDRRVLEQENVGWNHLVQDRDRFWAAGNTAMINHVII